jgi:hypothetical protein
MPRLPPLSRRLLLPACCALLVSAGCEKTPSPFAKVDGAWTYRGVPIAGADTATFAVLSDHYAKDRAHVWYADTYRDGREYWSIAHPRVFAIDDADAASFRYLARDIAQDASAVYDEGRRHSVRDIASFALQDDGFARDRVAGYCHLTEIPGSDGGTFARLDAYYAKDRWRAYFCSFGTDGDGRPAHAKFARVADGRVASFRPLDRGYAVDGQVVYYRGEVMPDADPATFSVLGATDNGVDARDARHNFTMGRRVPAP